MEDKKKTMMKSSSDVFHFTSEVRRLEKNIGDFTRKLEHERRASILLDKEIQEMVHILNEKKEVLKAAIWRRDKFLNLDFR